MGNWQATQEAYYGTGSGFSGRPENISITHELKTDPGFFKAAYDGLKPFEVRLNDRDFRTGDLVILKEYDSTGHGYTGKTISGVI